LCTAGAHHVDASELHTARIQRGQLCRHEIAECAEAEHVPVVDRIVDGKTRGAAARRRRDEPGRPGGRRRDEDRADRRRCREHDVQNAGCHRDARRFVVPGDADATDAGLDAGHVEVRREVVGRDVTAEVVVACDRLAEDDRQQLHGRARHELGEHRLVGASDQHPLLS
jgi:hypothetical protein